MYFPRRAWERRPDGRQQLLAYAVGCNPDTDPFDDWWHLAGRELGGDDFAEYFDPKDGLFTRLLHSADDLVLSATATHLSLAVVPSRLKRQPPRSPRSPRTGAFFVRTAAIAAHARSSPAAKARPPTTAPACHRRRPHEHIIDLAEAAPAAGVAAHGQRLRAGTIASPSGPGCEVRPGRHAGRQRPDPAAVIVGRPVRGTWTMAGR